MSIETLTPGIYQNVDESVYHAIDVASYSRLKKIVQKSAAHCRESIVNPKDPTPDMIMGSALDCAIWTPEQFEMRFEVADCCSARTKEGKPCKNSGKICVGNSWLCGVHLKADRYQAIFASIEAGLIIDGCKPLENTVPDSTSKYFQRPDGRRVRVSDHAPNARSLAWMLRNNVESIRVDQPPHGSDDPREILNSDQMDRVLMMRESLLKHKEASRLIRLPGPVQTSGIFIEPESGLKCKFRTDKLIPKFKTVIDLKKTGIGADKETWEKEIFARGYHLQGAMYPEGLTVLGESYDNFVHIVVEDEAPFAVGVYRIKDDVLAMGWDQLRPAIQTYAQCEKSGKWPAYSDKIEDIGVPDWAMRKINKQLLEEIAQ